MLRATRGCAYAGLGRKEAAADDLIYAKAHEKDAPDALQDLLLCMGDLDEAAALLKRRLANPNQRIRVLVELSDFADPPVRLPSAPSAAGWRALKARPDVQAVAAQAGGTGRFDVLRDEI